MVGAGLDRRDRRPRRGRVAAGRADRRALAGAAGAADPPGAADRARRGPAGPGRARGRARAAGRCGQASDGSRQRRCCEQRLEAAEQRLATVVSRSAVIRYDAYNEMTGRQSSSIALLDDGATGIVLSSILHREQARVYAKPVVEGDSELELSPEEREAIKEAMAPVSAASPTSGPAGTFTEDALLAAAGDADVEHRCRSRRSTTRSWRSRRERPKRALGPVRELDRGLGARRPSTRSPSTPSGVAIVGEHDHPVRHALIARDRRWPLDQIEVVLSHPQAIAQCARFLREQLPAADGALGLSSTAEAVRWSPSRRRRGRRSARRSAARSTDATCSPRASRTPPDNVTRFVWLAPADGTGARGRTAPGRPRSSSPSSARTTRARWSRRCRVLRPGDQPDPDRVAAAAAGPRPLHVLLRPRGRGRGPGVAEAIDGAARARPSRCGSSAAIRSARRESRRSAAV